MELAPRDGRGSMARVEDILKKIRRRFDATDEHAKVFRGDLANIRQKLDAHAISIKHLELQMAQLYSTVNPRQPSTLPRNTVQDPKNDGHSMTVTTQGDNKIIDPPMPSGVEDYIRGDDVVEEVNGELVEKSGKEAEIPQKMTPIPRPPPPFLQ